MKFVQPLLRFATVLCMLGGMSTAMAQTTVIDEEQVSDTKLEEFRDKIQKQYPDLEVVDVRAKTVYEGDLKPKPAPAVKTAAIFVRNQSRKPSLDDEVDGLRDLISAEMAAGDIRLMDANEIASAFHKYKVTTEEARSGMVKGLFSGGSVTRMTQMLNADYIILVSVNYADVRSRKVGGVAVKTYRTTMPVKVLDGKSGATVYGTVVKKTYPTQGAGGTDDSVYYYDLFEKSSEAIASTLLASMPKWRAPSERAGRRVQFTVSTTIDQLVDGLASGTRAPNDLLDELRRVVGGVTVELDGAAIGSTPGTFTATPGLHQLRLTRQWMEPWQKTVNIQDGATFKVALELSDAGLARFKSLEGFKAATALTYAEAAYKKGIKINFDTQGWRDVAIGDRGTDINMEKTEQIGVINQSE